MQDKPKTWLENRTIIIAWLIFLFPVGLYAVWKSSIFDTPQKQKITGIVLLVTLGAGLIGLEDIRNTLYIFILYPIAIYLLWKDINVVKVTRYLFCGALVVIYALYFGSGITGNVYKPDNCIAVQEQNGCTYYRDENCIVISRVCG